MDIYNTPLKQFTQNSDYEEEDVSFSPNNLELVTTKSETDFEVVFPSSNVLTVENNYSSTSAVVTPRLFNLTHSDMRRIKEKKNIEKESVLKYKNIETDYQSTLTQLFDTNSKIEKKSPIKNKNKFEDPRLQTRNEPFDVDDTLESSDFTQRSEKRYFESYLKTHIVKRELEEENSAKKKKKKRNTGRSKTVSVPPYCYQVYDMKKDGKKTCKHCNTKLTSCHDVLFGMFCISAVVRYYKENTTMAEDLVAKKVFINSYNNALEFHNFKITGKMRAVEMVYPPICLEQNSYEYATYWMEWKKKGMWLEKKVDKCDRTIPKWFYEL